MVDILHSVFTSWYGVQVGSHRCTTDDFIPTGNQMTAIVLRSHGMDVSAVQSSAGCFPPCRHRQAAVCLHLVRGGYSLRQQSDSVSRRIYWLTGGLRHYAKQVCVQVEISSLNIKTANPKTSPALLIVLACVYGIKINKYSKLCRHIRLIIDICLHKFT